MENKEIELTLIDRAGKPGGREIVKLEHIVSWGDWFVYPTDQSNAPTRKATRLSLTNGRSLFVNMSLDDFIIELKNVENNE